MPVSSLVPTWCVTELLKIMMRDSTMTTHPFDILNLPDSGRFIFTPCPGTKGVDLSISIGQLKRVEADAVITMMSYSELAKFDVSDLPNTVRQSGMTWFQFPVEDDADPDEKFEMAWQSQKSEVLSMIKQGKCIAIHCRGGSGRTGFMAAVIMRELGIDKEESTNLVKSLRPNSLKLTGHTECLSNHYDITP
jgi:protein-tyrosine phosphatase